MSPVWRADRKSGAAPAAPCGVESGEYAGEVSGWMLVPPGRGAGVGVDVAVPVVPCVSAAAAASAIELDPDVPVGSVRRRSFAEAAEARELRRCMIASAERRARDPIGRLDWEASL